MTTAVTPPASISVVLPVFMRSTDPALVHLLRRALESVFDQTYPGALEILVIDDGSPTPVRDTMRGAEMSDWPAIRWIRNERHNGLVQALNTGIRVARHELIARLDADDRWLPGKIAAQANRFGNAPDLSLVATGMTVVDAQGRELEQHVRLDGWENILRLASERGWCPFPHGSVVALTSVYRLLGGYSHEVAYRHCEDYHLWSNWIRFFKPAMVEALLYEYRRVRGAVSEVHKDEQMVATRRVHRRLAAVVDWRTHPGHMRSLAGLLGLSLLQCGALCYRIWRYGPEVRMPERAGDVLQRILPDRDLHIGDGGAGGPIWTVEDLVDDFPGAGTDRPAADDNAVVYCPN